MDAGSIPASSTKSHVDESQLNQAIAFINKGCSFFDPSDQLVSNGPNWPQECHHSDTIQHPELESLGTRDCKVYRNRIFNRHPYIANSLAKNYLNIHNEKNLREANLFIGRIDKELLISDLNLSSPISEIKKFCEDRARRCELTILEYGESTIAFDICSSIAKKYRLPFVTPETDQTFIPLLNRFKCARWWLRKVNQLRNQHIELVNIKLNLVNKNVSSYASNFALETRRVQLMNSFEYLAENTIVNEQGQSYTLLELFNKSVSNPFIRKAELMTRIRGFEEVAEHMGHAGEFYTITAPSKYHATSCGKQNSKFQGFSPEQTNQYLTKIWSLVRSSLHKKNIRPYGFRVVEPHHDATPHWHLLLFMHPEDVKTVRETIKKYAMLEDSNEPGAQKHRFNFKSIDPTKGSASGYIAKYISKNIDGSDISQDLYGNDAKSAANKIDAWSSTWCVRQFQQIGGPSVTVWRELRKLKSSDNPAINAARLSADAGDWASYVLAMGGPILPRRNRPIQPYYQTNESEFIDQNTGEITKSSVTRYGDLKAPTVKGLKIKEHIITTRKFNWKRQTQPMTFCGAKNEYSDTELVKNIYGRDPRKREGPIDILGLV